MPRLVDILKEDEAQAEAAAREVVDARKRLRKHPVAQWASAVAKLEERRQIATDALATAEANATAAALNVATGAKDADAAHDEAHSALIGARSEDEKSAAVLAAAQAELRASNAAQEIVSRADYEVQQRNAFEADKK